VPPSPVSATPSPTSSAPAPCPNRDGGTCLGPLSAGTYTTRTFQPRISYLVPTGWGNYEDLPGNFELLPPGFDLAGGDAGTADYIGVYAHIEAETAQCDGAAPDAETSPAGIATWLAGQKNLAVTVPRKTSIGGLEGVVIDLELAKDFKPVVDWSTGRCVIIGQSPSGLEHGIGPGASMRLYLLANPLAPGATLAIEIDDVTGSDALDTYSDLVRQFRFED
jgi:hypothetical protein